MKIFKQMHQRKVKQVGASKVDPKDDFGSDLYKMSKGLLKKAKEMEVQSSFELAAAVTQADVESEAPKQGKPAPKMAAPAPKPSVAQVTKVAKAVEPEAPEEAAAEAEV